MDPFLAVVLTIIFLYVNPKDIEVVVYRAFCRTFGCSGAYATTKIIDHYSDLSVFAGRGLTAFADEAKFNGLTIDPPPLPMSSSFGFFWSLWQYLSSVFTWSRDLYMQLLYYCILISVLAIIYRCVLLALHITTDFTIVMTYFYGLGQPNSTRKAPARKVITKIDGRLEYMRWEGNGPSTAQHEREPEGQEKKPKQNRPKRPKFRDAEEYPTGEAQNPKPQDGPQDPQVPQRKKGHRAGKKRRIKEYPDFMMHGYRFFDD